MFPQEPHRHENQGQQVPVQYVSRAKLGLETPLVGRFWRETRLTFAPPLLYDWLVVLVTVGGILGALNGIFSIASFGFEFSWWTWVGAMVFVAGVLGFLSSERMTIDTRKKTYWRREGQGPFKRFSSGPLAELDAVVLQASEYPAPQLSGRTIIYRIVIFWKNNKQPLFIAEKDIRAVQGGMPMNAGAGVLLQKGVRYAQAMGLPFYDNSHFHSKDPQRFI